MLSEIINGKVDDWKFKKVHKDCYHFLVGENTYGTIMKMGNAWSCVACGHQLNGLRMVNGFGTRRHAAQYLVEVRSA